MRSADAGLERLMAKIEDLHKLISHKYLEYCAADPTREAPYRMRIPFQDWEAEFRAIEGRLPDLAEFRGRLADGPAMLADWFAASEQVLKAFGKVAVYTTLFASVDSGDQLAAARAEQRIVNTTAIADLSRVVDNRKGRGIRRVSRPGLPIGSRSPEPLIRALKGILG